MDMAFIPRIIDKFLDMANLKKHNDNNADIKTELDSHDAKIATADQHIANNAIHTTQAEKDKLAGIETGAEVNQSAFSKIAVSGQPDVDAEFETDTLTFAGGTGITVTTDPATDTVTFTATGEATPGPHASSHIAGGADVIPNAVANGSSGLMSGTDKARLDSHETQLSSENPTAVTLIPGVQIVNSDRKSRAKVTKMTGRTLINLLGRDGNMEDVSKWQAYQSTLALDSANKTVGSNSVKITLSAAYGEANQSRSLKAGKYYVLVADIKNGNATNAVLVASNFAAASATVSAPVNITDTTKFSATFRKISVTADTNITVAVGVNGAANQYAYGDAVRLYEISQAEYDALANMTADQVAAKYPYVDDVKHVNAVYAQNPGKNLLPPFSEWSLHTNAKVTDAYKLQLDATANDQVSYCSVSVMPNTSYTLSVTHNARIGVYKTDMNTAISAYTDSQSITFNSGDNVQLGIFFSSQALGAGTFTFDKPMLNSAALPFEPQKPSYLYLPDIQLRSNIDGSVTDTMFIRDGQTRAIRRFREMVLDGSLPWIFSMDFAGFKRVAIGSAANTLGNYVAGQSNLVKYDGKIIPSGPTQNSADIHALSGDTNFYVTIADADSGWGETYTPSSAEIQAYFWGWRMYNSAVAGSDALYTGATGETKSWRYVNKAAGGTSTLPTTQNPDAGFTPYRLTYQLAQSYEDAVSYEGDLFLHDGANQIEVGTGIVVREAAKPVIDPTAPNPYRINAGTAASWTKLRAWKFVGVQKNGIADKRWTETQRTTTNGSYLTANPSDVDPAAPYSVTYLALDTYALGIAPASISAEYAPNVKEALDDIALAVAHTRTQVSALQTTKAQKQPPQWITPTLLNGWVSSGYVGYFKDSNGFVHLRLRIKSGTVAQAILFLPVGYRPANSISPAISYWNGSAWVYCLGDINPVGQVTQINGGNADVAFGEVVFLAEV